MACPTCDHTMQLVNNHTDKNSVRVFWCPRCGTMKRGWESTGVGSDGKLGSVEIHSDIAEPKMWEQAGLLIAYLFDRYVADEDGNVPADDEVLAGVDKLPFFKKAIRPDVSA